MKEVDALISSIDLKIRKLTERLNGLKEENADLKYKQSEFKSLIEQQTDKIRSLEKKLNQLAISQSLESTDIDSARKKIGGLVREIDRCISLLNK